MKPSIPKGTRDFGPVEMARRNYIFDTIRSVYALYGFQQIELFCMGTITNIGATVLIFWGMITND